MKLPRTTPSTLAAAAITVALLYFVLKRFKIDTIAPNTYVPGAYAVPKGSDPIFVTRYDLNLHLYTVNGKPIIWVFWDYAPMPPFIQLSMETFRCHSYSTAHLMVVGDKFLKSTIKEIPEGFEYLSNNHKADFFRFSMIRKFGGMYLDADTIQLASVDHLFADLANYDIIGYSDPAHGAVVGVTSIGPVRANLSLLHLWARDADKMLKEKVENLRKFNETRQNYPIEWGGVNHHWNTNLKVLMDNKQLRTKTIDGPDHYGQIIRNSEFHQNLYKPLTAELLAKVEKTVNLTRTQYLFYFNSVADNDIRPMSIDKFITINSLFLNLVKYSISHCDAYKKNLYRPEILQKLMATNFSIHLDFT